MNEQYSRIHRESGQEAVRESGRRLKYSRVRYRRIFLIVTDLLGMGGAPDAPEYGDAAADTVTRLAGSREKPDVRNLRNLGLFNMKRIPGVDPITYMMGRYMPLSRKSAGTDLSAGFRELMGILPEEEAETFAGNTMPEASAQNTVPEALAEKSVPEALAGKSVPGALAEKSVPETFPAKIIPEALIEAGLDFLTAGSVGEAFNAAESADCASGSADCLCRERGMEAMDRVLDRMKKDFHGLCFADVGEDEVSPAALERFDRTLGKLMKEMNHNDLLLVTAVRGNDPASPGKDGSRERVPLVAWSPRFRTGGPLPGASTLAIVGATVCDNFGVALPKGTAGTSRWDDFW